MSIDPSDIGDDTGLLYEDLEPRCNNLINLIVWAFRASIVIYTCTYVSPLCMADNVSGSPVYKQVQFFYIFSL